MIRVTEEKDGLAIYRLVSVATLRRAVEVEVSGRARRGHRYMAIDAVDQICATGATLGGLFDDMRRFLRFPELEEQWLAMHTLPGRVLLSEETFETYMMLGENPFWWPDATFVAWAKETGLLPKS